MKGTKYFMWVLGLLALLILPLAAQAAPVGKFTRIEGRADITSPGQPARTAFMGDELSVGDIVRTKSKSKAEITFVDGNILRLAESTRVKITEYMVEEEKSSRVLNLFRGKIRNVVRTVGKKFGRERPHRHEVRTPTAVCGVRGTDHTDTHGPAGSQFVFHDGQGEVWSLGQPDKPVIVKEGEGVWVKVPNQIPITGAVTSDQQQKEKDATTPTEEEKIEEGEEKPEGAAPAKAPEKGAAGEEGIPEPEVGSAEETAATEGPPPADSGPKPTSVTGPPQQATKGPDTVSKFITDPNLQVIFVDTVKPEIIVENTPPSITNQKSASFAVTITDDKSSESEIEVHYFLNGVERTTTSFSGLAEGIQTFKVTAKDKAGNGATWTYEWTIDVTQPVISVTNQPPPKTNQNSASFAVTKTDNLTSPSEIEVKYFLNGVEKTSTSFSGLAEGIQTFKVTAKDKAGNQSTKEFTWTTDYTPPGISIANTPEAVTNQRTADFVVSFTDNVSSEGNISYSYKLDGVDVSTTTFSELMEGDHTFTVVATDEAGNSSEPLIYAWTIEVFDEIPPSIAIEFPGSVTPGTEPATILATVAFNISSDEDGTLYYSVDEGPEQTAPLIQDAPITVSLSGLEEGEHTVKFTPEDSSGNTPESPVTFQFSLKRYKLTGSASGTGSVISADVADENPGVVFAVPEETWGGWRVVFSNGSYEGTPSSSWSLKAGGEVKDSSGTKIGYWLDKIPSVAAADGNLSGDSTFTYLTNSALGEGTGSFQGDYGEGTWNGTDTGIGSLTETSLAFSSVFDEKTYRLVGGTAHGGYFERIVQEDGYSDADYDYEYFISGDGRLRYGDWWKDEWDEGVSEGEVYLPDGTKYEFDQTSWFSPFRRIGGDDWPVGSDKDADFISMITSPGGNPSGKEWVLTDTDQWPSNTLTTSGTFAGIMGGTGNLWTASASSPANIYLMGKYEPYESSPGIYEPLVFGLEIQSSDITSGAYRGYLGGVINDVEGGLYAVYVDPSENAGILKGTFSGDAFPEIGMWEASGSMYAMEKAQGAGISAQNFINYPDDFQDKGFIAGWVAGDIASELGWGSTLSIRDHDDWGVFGMVFGYENYKDPYVMTTWAARAGGWAEFGSHPTSDGRVANIGMWLIAPNSIVGGVNNSMLTAENFTGEFLTLTKYGNITGDLIGTHDTDTWQAAVGGYWENDQNLYFNGILDGDLMRTYVSAMDDGSSPFLAYDGYIEGLMGGLGELWGASYLSPADILSMGEYAEWWDGYGSSSPPVFSLGIWSYNPYHDNTTIWNQGDSHNGAYYGYAAGRGLEDYSLEGTILALYLDKDANAGILKGSFEGQTYPELEMWRAEGSIFPIELVQSTGYDAANLYPRDPSDPYDPGLIYETYEAGPLDSHGQFYNAATEELGGDIHRRDWESWVSSLSGEKGGKPWVFGVRTALYGGTYEEFCGALYDHWGWGFFSDDGTTRKQGMMLSSPDSPQTDGKWSNGLISGKGYGSWVNWNSAVTGVSGADLKGTFDPANHTWQAASMWAFMDTHTFLDLASTPEGQNKLAQFDIPYMEVGKAHLSGSQSFEGGSMSVNMYNVAFFAYSSGAAPRIWATNQVGGAYTGTPIAGVDGWSVPLTSTNVHNTSNLQAEFQLQRWNFEGNGKWGASVDQGSGVVNGKNITFSGAAAGKIGTGTFLGKGSGTVSVIPD